MHSKIKCTLFILLSAAPLFAQQELMQYALPNLWHSNSLNPAFFPHEKRIAIGLPGIAIDAAHSGDISYNDVFIKDGDRRILDLGNAISKLEDNNELFAEQRIETFSLGLRLNKKIALFAGHANRLSLNAQYPKNLAALIWNGNGNYIGQTLQIAPAADLYNWNEWSAGLSIPLKKVTLGAKAKLLAGTAGLISDAAHKKATVYTNPDIYQLEMETDYGFHSASVVSSFDTSGYGFDLKLAELENKLFSKNTGIAFDLGARFDISDRLSLSASILDLGGVIKWKDNANYYLSQGKYTYEGANLDLLSGSDSLSFDQKLDSLNDIFQFKKSDGSFETRLPVRIYLGGRFQLTQRLALSLSLYRQSHDARSTGAAGLGLQWMPMKWISVGGMYSINDQSAANLGFHLMLRPGPLQLYLCSDNLLNAFQVKSKPAANLRVGGALVF